ncbi:MAG: hypothetical protein COY39_05835 [Alphaproteobacteria bacterium CG_4_10_14_0_8_um_filter_37_21]|nr:MAG: hypothetical protein COY39_05835 [Alphaproteobacteria bacterium CG_4_10_14_0_8_um_filter_37_21]
MILSKKNNTLYLLMLSTSIASFSTNQAVGLTPGPGEQAEFDEDNNDPIFYVPQSALNNDGNYTGTGGAYGYGYAYGYDGYGYQAYNVDYRDGEYVVLNAAGDVIDDFSLSSNITNDIVNANIAAFDSSKASVEVNTEHLRDAFRGSKYSKNKGFSLFTPRKISKKEDNITKAQSVLKAIGENGPMELKTDQYRLWVAPFSSQTNVTGESASRDWLLGILSGFQYDNKKYKYTLGTFVGLHVGNNRSKVTKENGDNITGASLGIYGSYGAWEGGRIDAMFMHNPNKISTSRLTTQGLAKSDKDLNLNTLNLQTSHVFKIPGDIWSVRLNLGHVYTEDKTSGYTERGAGAANFRKSSETGKSYEALAGVGVRWNNSGEEWRTRITGVYEIGKEYSKTGSGSRISVGNNFSTTLNVQNSAKGEVAHYATLYTTINNSSGWKFFLGYNGTFSKNTVGTAFALKGEYRF